MKALADETRLRILGILVGQRLSVNEIIEVLSMGQSRVSRHLKILLDAGLLESERDGTRIYYGIPSGEDAFRSGLLRVLGLTPERWADDESGSLAPEEMRDRERLALLLEERKRFALNHFQKFGTDEESAQREYVDSDYYIEEILSLIGTGRKTVADLGCGGGDLAGRLIGRAERIICVDQSPNMLAIAQKRIGAQNADFRIGSIEHLPMGDAEADAVVLSMVLHHLPDPEGAIREAGRVLKEGGDLIVAELARHDHEVMRTHFADFYLGFDPERIQAVLKRHGFRLVRSELGRGAGRIDSFFIVARKERAAAKKRLFDR
jgi:ArsR family transcriptional regulator